jgi:hypothetical protein
MCSHSPNVPCLLVFQTICKNIPIIPLSLLWLRSPKTLTLNWTEHFSLLIIGSNFYCWALHFWNILCFWFPHTIPSSFFSFVSFYDFSDFPPTHLCLSLSANISLASVLDIFTYVFLLVYINCTKEWHHGVS